MGKRNKRKVAHNVWVWRGEFDTPYVAVPEGWSFRDPSLWTRVAWKKLPGIHPWPNGCDAYVEIANAGDVGVLPKRQAAGGFSPIYGQLTGRADQGLISDMSLAEVLDVPETETHSAPICLWRGRQGDRYVAVRPGLEFGDFSAWHMHNWSELPDVPKPAACLAPGYAMVALAADVGAIPAPDYPFFPVYGPSAFGADEGWPVFVHARLLK